MKTNFKVSKRIISLVLTALLVLSMIPVSGFSAFAEELSEATEGLPEISVTLKDADGDGYYDIGNADELNAFITLVNDGNPSLNAELTADIFMNKGVVDEENSIIELSTTPIGSAMNPYTGVFDGNNHVVSGFNSRSSLECDGLFCCVGEGGVVKNTGVINSFFGGARNCVGAVVGINKGTVTNCYNDNSTLRSNSGVIGGVVGFNEGTVANCYSIGDVRGRECIGGVVGYNAGVITNCYNTGTVDGGSYVGGMVGSNEGTITNCYYLDTCGASDINAVSKTSEEFKSGEVAYLLQEGQTEEIWGQKIGTDAYPVLGGDKVYFAKDCIGESCYSNTNEDGQHYFRNGFCACGELFEAAKLNEDGVYEIGNAGQLYWFAKYVNAGNTSANAILTDNIVVNEGVMTSESTDARDWTPIGNDRNNYAGTFDGNGKTISGLYFDFAIEIWGNNVGLIGYMSGGSVSNVGVINSYFNGYGAVGSIVGYCDSGTVTNCYNTGAIGGRSEAGGIVGWNEAGTVTNCYNTGAVSGEGGVGGIIGFSSSSGNISNCYNTGKIVSSSWNAGGVIGQSASTVTNCYNTGEVICDYYGGGVIGHNAGTVSNCYNIGEVSCNRYGGGVMGYSSIEITNCYYLNTTFNGGVGGFDEAGSAEAETDQYFKSGEVAYLLQGTQEEEIWGQKLGTDNYPVLGGDKVYGGYTACADTKVIFTNDADISEERIPHNYVNGFCTGCGGIESATDKNEDGVFEIGNAGQLYWFAEYVNAGDTYSDAILTDNIVVNEGEMASNSTDARVWTPIGNKINKYKGTFDGNNKTVSGLYFNNSEAEYVGLFGYIGETGAVNAEVKNIGIINSYFKGLMFVGGVVGYAQGVTITNCYNTSTVVGQNYAGGMAGYAEESTVANCYSTGVIDGNDGIGMIGWIMNVTVDNCYYLDTSCYIGIGNGSDAEGSIEAKTSEEFASGEVAYLLQGTKTDDIWGQKIGTDELPVLGGDKVYYGYTSCEDDATAVYTNDSNVASGNIHNFVNGFCTLCDGFEPATDENEDGIYEIGNAGQLYWFADKVNNDNTNFGSADAILTEDIVVNEGVMTAETEGARVWTPIGKRTQETIGYGGSFDGQNFTVSGLYCNDSKAAEAGMFGVLYGGSVKNIGVINSYINGDGYVGGVVGWNNISEVTNCYNTGVVNGSWSTGGVVGYNYYSTLSNCYNTGAVSSEKFIGGVAGGNYMATLANCYYLDSTCSGGIDGADVAGSAEAKTAEQFKSGEVAYLLQGEQAEEIWGQNIGTDNYPVLGGDKVYAVTKCNGEAVSYNNTKSETLDHPTFKNGFCTLCEAYEPATDENEDGVYEISNAGQLYWFADKVNNDNAHYGSANAILTADIVVNEGVMTAESEGARVWTPIGNFNSRYSGSFDGNNKTVSGLYLNESSKWYVGLFGFVYNGTVKNTGVINSYFCGSNDVGAIAGVCNSGEIINCYNESIVVGDSYTGGVAGYNQDSTMTDCYNSGNVSGNHRIAGVVGFNQRSIISNTYNTGVIGTGECVGGIVGESDGGAIESCYNAGEIIGRDTYRVGGIIGQNRNGSVDNCYNIGTVDGTDSMFVGGIAGNNIEGTITNCYYLNTACEGGIDGSDLAGSAEAKTAEQFKGGEVAYLLQGEQEELVWGQKIGTDELPVLGGDKVYYGYTSCADNATAVYTNDSSVTAEKPAHKEFRAEFTWDKPYDGECYVSVELYCTDCGGYVDSGSSYATLKETVEADDCMHPGSELYEVTFEYEGVTYTDTKSFTLKSDNHTGEFVNGFCTDCGGFEPAKYNEETGVYEIENAGQLYWYAQKLNEENAEIYAKLMNDIIIPDDAPNWTPINCSNAYFDGNFKTISGLMCVDTDADYVGLFGCEGWWYEISNLHITDSYFEGKDYVGAVVACMTNGGSVTNCYVTNTTVKGDSDNSGTLVGYMVLGNIINCYVDTDNLVGYYNDSYATVENSYYLADTDDGNGGKTLEQFASGEVAYLLQAGVQSEDIYDDNWNVIDTIIPEIWGQNIGTDDYPVLNGDKVYYGYETCDENIGLVYTNTEVSFERPNHNFVDGVCTDCSKECTHKWRDGVCTICGMDCHHNEFENGFCKGICSGYESAKYNEAEDVYEISNAGQLYWFREYVNDGNTSANAILTADIVVNEGVMTSETKGARVWIPIGKMYVPYDGTFDGKNHTISGLYFNNYAPIDLGLFCSVSGTVSNLGVINSYLKTSGSIGGVAGENSGTIINCFNSSTIVGDSPLDTGGLVGENTGMIINCYNVGSVSNTYEDTGAPVKIGGIYGRNDGTATNCYYLNTSCNSTDTGTISKTIEQFNNGEVAYLLQGEQEEEIWGQKIGAEDFPTFKSYKVYCTTDCKGEIAYTNAEKADGVHSYVGGVCEHCGDRQPSVNEIELLKIAYIHLLSDAEEYNILDSRKEDINDINTLFYLMDHADESNIIVIVLDLAKRSIGNLKTELENGVADGTWVKADYTDIDTAIAQLKASDALTEKVGAAIEKIESELSVMKANPETSKADVAVLMKEVEALKDCVSGNHIFENGFCTICGEEEPVDKLAGYTISLGDKIAVNYYMSLTEKTIADANAKMVFTVPDTGSTYTLEIPVSEAVKSGDYYVFTCEVAAKEMTSVIKAKLVTSESELVLDDYTVQEYAEVILSDTVKYAKEQKLVKSMLNYGAEAQIYFNYNTDNLANDTELMTEEEKTVELYGFAGAPFTLEGEETGVTYYGTALSLETELVFKHYFIIDESVDAQSLEITCDYPATLKKNGNIYELIISDIPAHKMGENSLKVALGGITLDYTIYSYGALAQNAGKEALWTVVSALAHFAQEATVYAYK